MIAWPFRPNWSTPYQHRYEFLTELIVSDSGREQRRALRVAARRTIEYAIMETAERFRAVRRTIARMHESVIFADEPLRTYLSATGASGGYTIALTIAPSWVRAGGKLVLWDAATKAVVVHTVFAVSGLTATLVEPLDRTWPTDTLVMCGLAGRLAADLKPTYRTDAMVELTVSLEVDPGTEFEDAGTAITTFNGREVFLHPANWSQAIEIPTTNPVEWVDPGMGVRAAFRQINFLTEIRQSLHRIKTTSDVNQIVGLFLRSRGRQGEFYLPSGLQDIVPTLSVSSGGRFWRVAGHDFCDAYDDSTVHRAFCVTLASGATLFFRVVNIVTGGTTDPYSEIETVETAPYAIAPADVVRASWMPAARFATDDLVVKWLTDGFAEVVLNLQTLEDLP